MLAIPDDSFQPLAHEGVKVLLLLQQRFVLSRLVQLFRPKHSKVQATFGRLFGEQVDELGHRDLVRHSSKLFACRLVEHPLKLVQAPQVQTMPGVVLERLCELLFWNPLAARIEIVPSAKAFGRRLAGELQVSTIVPHGHRVWLL
jgi:hypothetical protein